MLSAVSIPSAWSCAAASLASAQDFFCQAAELALSGDIVEGAVGMSQAKLQARASALVLRTLDEMSGNLIDLLA